MQQLPVENLRLIFLAKLRLLTYYSVPQTLIDLSLKPLESRTLQLRFQVNYCEVYSPLTSKTDSILQSLLATLETRPALQPLSWVAIIY